jgi:hypothetical protein
MGLPVQGMINCEQALRSNDVKSMLGHEVLEAIASVSLKVRWDFVFGLKKWHFENDVPAWLEHTKQFGGHFLRIFYVLQDCDAKYGVEMIVIDGDDV